MLFAARDEEMIIIFGVIGLSGGRPGGGMALAGLLLGIATILLPIFIYAWIGAM